MQKQLKRIGLALVAVGLCLVLLLTAAIPVCEAGPHEGVVKIGLNTVFTGPIATTGVPIATGAIAYADYVNEHGGIDGIRVDVRWRETRGEVPRAITAYRRFKEEGVVVMMDTMSACTETLTPLLQRDKIPMVTQQAFSPLMVTKPIPWIFGGTPGWGPMTIMSMRCVLDYMWAEERPAKAGMMMYDHVSGWSCNEAAEEYFDDIGIEYIGREVVPLMGAIDTSVEWLRLANKKPDFIFTLAYGATLTTLIKDAYRLEIQKRGINLVSTMAGLDEQFLPVVGAKACEGWYVGKATCILGEEGEYPMLKNCYEYGERHGWEREKMGTTYLLCGWMATQVAIEGIRLAIEKVGYENLDGPAVRDGVASIREFDTGLAPLFSVSDASPYFPKHFRLCQAQGGKIVVVGDWLPFEDISFSFYF